MIRDANINDAAEICDIYNPYILNSTISFETEPVTETEMAARISGNGKLPWLVYQEDDKILGYAYATKWRIRQAYRYSVESAVYIDSEETGRGIGTLLYTELIKRLISMNIHAVIGGIALPNPASIALHEKFGFEKVTHFKEVGFKFNQWIDVGYWELILKK
ncbi:MAG: N-acetyltransferase [Calditrichaceae bacterium]|nr:N-acetyltransferase [Calditrichaceae bacterium]